MLKRRKNKFEDLAKSKELQYKTLIESLPQKIFIKDLNSNYVSCNENYARDLKIKAGDIAGKTDFDFFPTYLAEKYRAADKRVMESGQIETIEEEYVVIADFASKFEEKFINTVKVPIREEDGKIVGLLGIFWDITERKKAEEKIINLNKQIEFILGVTKTGLDVIDSEFNLVYVDPAWQKVYGDPAGKKCYKYFMDRNKECPNCGIRRALETKSVVVTEEILAKEGNRPVQVTTIPFQDKNGNWLVAEVNVDITERKQAEERISLSEKKIRALFDQTFQFIGMLTPDGKIIEANKTALQFAGITEADCIGRFFWDTAWWTHSREMQEKLRDGITKAAAGEPVFFEATHVAVDKSLHYIDFSLKPVKSHSGKVIFIIPEGRDITAHKQIEIELKEYRERLEELVDEKTREIEESEKKFKAIFDNSKDGILLADAKTRKFTLCNKMIAVMLGYTEEELKSLGVSDIHAEKDLPQVIEIFDKQARGELSTVNNLPVLRKDGSIFYADITVSPIVLAGNKMLVGSFRDVTTRKEVEDILKRDKEAFEKLVQERTKELVDVQMELERNKRLSDIGFLAATVAHELRNPLATINMAAYGIKQEAATPGIKKHLASIEKKIKESDQIISNLLFYSRLKPPHYENVSILEIIDDVISSITEHREKYVEIIKNNDSLKTLWL
jgi:PAS domain S-box-containing protein